MPTFLFLAAICLIVVASILLETVPKANSSAGRMLNLLDSGDRADVHFLVGEGDEKKLLPAHKAILEKASGVFEGMFRFDEANAKAAATEF
uniref:BTB domain-containing protein n=1 Tax=Globodera rostochiensis TaxID=31243 RepID=A0A914IGL6_GLORO